MIDANGILNVTARDVRTGRERSLDVKPSYGLTDEEVERMLEESIDFAEDDELARALSTPPPLSPGRTAPPILSEGNVAPTACAAPVIAPRTGWKLAVAAVAAGGEHAGRFAVVDRERLERRDAGSRARRGRWRGRGR